MPVINASAGLASGIAEVATGAMEGYTAGKNTAIAQDQDQQRLDQLQRELKLREAEFALRKQERQRILGERQTEIATESRKLRRQGANNVGAAAIQGAMGAHASGLDPMNPMFWGYAGEKIAQEVERMGTEIMEFESVMKSLPDAARRELGAETAAALTQSLQSKQDKLRRYGATSQINEWLAQHPEDGEAFAPVIEAIRNGQISPESGLSHLMERQQEMAMRATAQRNAAQVEAMGQAMIQALGTLGSGTSKVAQAAIAGATMRVAMGGDVDSAVAAMMTDMLSPQVQAAMVDNFDRSEGAKLRAAASKQARRELAENEFAMPPGYPAEKWGDMDPAAKLDVWTLYHMGQDWLPKEGVQEDGSKAKSQKEKDDEWLKGQVKKPFADSPWSREPMNLSGAKQRLSTAEWETDSERKGRMGSEAKDRKALSMMKAGATDEEIEAFLRGE